jgi:alpha-mannosidase
VDDELVHVQTDGVGVWPVDERLPISRSAETTTAFIWQNAHYTAAMNGTGSVRIGAAVYGALAVYAETGDTYSEERGGLLGALTMQGPLTVEERSAQHCVVRFDAGWSDAGRRVDAIVRIHFDQSPLLRWTVDLDSRGTDMRVEMHFVTGIAPGAAGHVAAGMPFDVVMRPVADTDLLPRVAPPELATILLGQRELNTVDTFPFHDFVAVTDGRRTAAILARGLRAYAADALGGVRLPLRRAVEWLTRADLHNRVGDAGPFFYVPGARCERSERHELALIYGEFAPESTQMQAINAAFQNPPLLVEVSGHGAQRTWPVLRAEVPLSSLHVHDGALLARLYNPTDQLVQFGQPQLQTDVWGAPGDELTVLAPKRIATVQLPAMPAAAPQPAPVQWLTPPAWRVGVDATQPDATVLAALAEQVATLDAQAAALTEQIAATDDGIARLRLQHRLYIVQRESAEARLSLLLNQRKLAESEVQRRQSLYEPDPEIAAIGLELNQLRIKRRIFDYVIAAL